MFMQRSRRSALSLAVVPTLVALVCMTGCTRDPNVRKQKYLASAKRYEDQGKLKEAHANNDKISAVRIGKAYLAGTAKTVWVPDARTQERHEP